MRSNSGSSASQSTHKEYRLNQAAWLMVEHVPFLGCIDDETWPGRKVWVFSNEGNAVTESLTRYQRGERCAAVEFARAQGALKQMLDGGKR